MSQEFLPRNEFEMCELFEDLLFMKTEKYMFHEDTLKSEHLKFSNGSIELLAKLGILNRIFRRWFQTTWGLDSWSSHFEGETPRQELAKLYPELNRGEMFLSVKLVCEKEGWRVRPFIFSKKFFNGEDLFLYGLKLSGTQKDLLFEPHFDIGFRSSIKWLLKSEEVAEKLKSYQPPVFEAEKYWRLFWEQAGANLVFNSGLALTESHLLALSLVLQDCLTEFFASQEKGEDNFLDTDILFSELWPILRKSDKNLLPLEEITNEKLEKGLEERRDRQFFYSSEVFYRLGVAFDELILFPTEWYFGGAEIVWTDKMNFLQDLVATIELLNNKLKLPKVKSEAKKRFFPKIEDIEFDLSRLWFAPCTSFRSIGQVYQYFH